MKRLALIAELEAFEVCFYLQCSCATIFRIVGAIEKWIWSIDSDLVTRAALLKRTHYSSNSIG